MTDLFPEKLSAAGVAARFCAEPEIWDTFERWMRVNGYLGSEAQVNREFMLESSSAIRQVVCEIEIEMAARLTSVLRELLLQFAYVAGSGSMRRDEHRSFLPPGEYRGTEGREGGERRKGTHRDG